MMPSIHFDADEDFGLLVSTPPRSTLFSLVPFGAHSPMQEGLLSLLVRTSRAHGVNVRQLIEHVLAVAEPSIVNLTGSAFYRRYAGTLNGLGPYAEQFSAVMSQLTGTPSLRQTTLLPWMKLFPHNGQALLADRPKWCPECLNHQRMADETSWHPLAWSFKALRWCPAHRCELEEACPHCGKRQPFIPRHPDLATCHHCGQFLGGERELRDIPEFSLWLAAAVGDMVLHQARGGFAPTAQEFRDYIREQVSRATNGNRAAFCRQLGLNDRALNNWLSKDERPSFSQFMAICYGLNIMPTEIFGSGHGAVPEPALRHPEKILTRKASSKLGAAELLHIERRLEDMVIKRQGLPVTKIAAELGVGVSFLKYRFRALCDQLSELHRDLRTQGSIQHRQRQAERVAEIVREMRAAGIYPSRRRVNARLRQEKMSLAQPHIASAYRKACEDD
jgi:hypothetical protein